MISQEKRATDPIIHIVRKSKKSEEENHGGNWKIAYADFMTAMMAFFLVMWLTSSMSPEQKKGFSNYFDPVGVLDGASGVGGALGGRTITTDGPLNEMSAAMHWNQPLGAETRSREGLGAFEAPDHSEDNSLQYFEKTLQEKMIKDKDLQEMMDFVRVTWTMEGVRIDLLENYRQPMFRVGQSTLEPMAQKLFDVVAETLQKLPNPIRIEGHTDARTYATQSFTNWELSSARAQTVRRHLVSRIPHLNIQAIVGKGARDLYVPDEPLSSLNRRISLIVVREEREFTSDNLDSQNKEAHHQQQGLEDTIVYGVAG